ncbi:NUDIX domain-containing protein [Streptomyces sp. NBC_00234]|uniref:NUDIX domain-containing protein n=1 Tax=Streptomyces sp. NBC_00234 TaxID=2903638 RepID=UPI002E2B12E9|nr:NUDIX domain-containing protein [Streptomyces sp. NBC_00234]
MDDQPHTVDVHFDGDKLILEQHRDEAGTFYTFPLTDTAEPPGPRAALPWAEALHARIHPIGTAEKVLRAWSTGRPPRGTAPHYDPTTVPPVRVRAGCVVIRDDRMLLIRCEDEGTHYEIPGGGVEAGETPETAAVRELREETALHGTPVREVARTWRENRRGHYYLMAAEGEVGAAETLDNYGGRPEWVPVRDLPTTPLWPRRLSWRIAHWHSTGWPVHPAELADSINDLDRPCSW